jgi:flagellar hook-basal body complex protein FliE
MNVSSISALSPSLAPPTMPTMPTMPGAGDSTGGLFSHVLGNMLGQAASQQQVADQAVLDVAVGKTDNLHNVVLEVAKADLAFRLMLEIRNRLSDAYQEVMKMQV